MWENNIPASIRIQFLHADGSVASSADQDLANFRLLNVGDAEADTDGLSKGFADGLYEPLIVAEDAIDDVTGGPATTDTDVEARAGVDAILAVLRTHGLIDAA